MQHENVRVTEVDSRRLQALVEGALLRDRRDSRSVEALEQHLVEADVVPPSRIGADVVTMNSEVQVTDLDTGETFSFRVVFPRMANSAEGSISVLAPLGMAVLGRGPGDEVEWSVPAGTRRLRVDAVLYQPERAGKDLAPERGQHPEERAS